MKKTVAIVALGSLLTVLLFGIFAIAGTPHQKGVAAVAVSRAIIEEGADAPTLRDSKEHFFHSLPLKVEAEPVSAAVEVANIPIPAETVPPRPDEYEEERRRLQSELELVRSALEQEKSESSNIRNEYSNRVQEASTLLEQVGTLRAELAEENEKNLARSYEVAQLKIAAAKVSESTVGAFAIPRIPMSMSFPEVAVASETLPAQLVIGGWEKGCPHCERLAGDVVDELTKLGWRIGYHESDQIQFVHIPTTEAAPHIRLYQNGQQVQEWTGYQRPIMLARALRGAWDTAGNHPQTAIAAAGPAGSIHAASQIQQVIGYFRDYIGEGVKAELRWDRSGLQAFPLLAKGDWSAIALFGGYGHMQLSAIGSKNLPIESLGFGYRVNGNDITFDLDPVMLKGIADLLGPKESQSVGSAPQFGPMTLLSVLSIVRDIWSLLHPSCDLILGGNVTATAVLNGDAITVDFQQAPSVKLVALFTFNLGVKQIVFDTTNVHVEFSGSRLVKSRDFRVE